MIVVKLRCQNHCIYSCKYHIVWIPKYRHKILVNGVDKYLSIKLKEVRKYHPEIDYIEISIQPDHVHLLLSFPPRYSISKVVQILKQNTEHELKNKFDFVKRLYHSTNSVWSTGYFVSTVGINEKTIQAYIKNQSKEDSGQAMLELP